ncbi:hypothetical protein [Ruegeria sp. HKCCD8929]|uniref:hypothetical protein n=1 Tax=Ruegeria sp. HKCCD8929 TaxID=2683006 RepID=UPI0014883C70|nr:hypothetical protein [Ruegeria sp. HKCCD8929]
MTVLHLTSDRFRTETGYRILVQVPEPDCDAVLQAILSYDPLPYGDYDRVAFATSGTQQFRSLPGGANAAAETVVKVPCLELSVFTRADPEKLEQILRATYDAHPYEEPVIQIVPAFRTCHIRGVDEDNPNRFWNRKTADWVPGAHRR